MTFSIFSRKFEIPNLIFTRIPFLFRDEGGVAHPPPAQNMLAHIPGSTVFESAGSLNRDLHFPGSTLLKSVEPRMCSHTFRDEGGVAHPPPNPEYARTHSGILQKVHSVIFRLCPHNFRDSTKSSLTHNPGFYKKFAHP